MKQNANQNIGYISIVLSLFFIAASFMAVILPTVVAEGNEYTVDSSGGKDYLTITAAVGAASNGDTIFVYPGNGYTENVAVAKRLIIQGTSGTPVVQPNSATPVFSVSSCGVTIKNLEIDGQNTEGVDGIFSTAVGVEGTGPVNFEDLEIYDCDSGIWLQDDGQGNYPRWHTIDNCDIHDNSLDGIHIIAESNPSQGNEANNGVEDCDLYQNDHRGVLILGDFCYVKTTTARYNEYGISISGNNNNILGDGSDTTTLVYNNTKDGVRIIGNENNMQNGFEIYNNGISNNDNGIYLSGDSNTITGTSWTTEDIHDNGGNGIYLTYLCDDNTISYCDINDNDESGIHHDWCNDNYISHCDFNGGDIGVSFIRGFRDSSDDLYYCDFYNLDTAVYLEGSLNVNINGVDQSDINGCTYAINAICYYDDEGPTYYESGGTITEYDIDSDTIINLVGYQYGSTEFDWEAIPNQGNLDVRTTFATWEEV